MVFSCLNYNSAVANNHRAVQCDLCDLCVYITKNHNGLNVYRYGKL